MKVSKSRQHFAISFYREILSEFAESISEPHERLNLVYLEATNVRSGKGYRGSERCVSHTIAECYEVMRHLWRILEGVFGKIYLRSKAK
jgi:hypothetical protein